MARKITKETWDVLVEAFRKWPKKWTKAGKAAGVHHSTAKRAWMSGLSSYDFGQVPIHRIIEEEQAAAAAALNGDLDVETIEDASRARSVQVRMEEARLTAAARSNAIEALEALRETTKGMRMLNVRIGAELERVTTTAKKKVDLKRGLGYLRNYSHIMLNLAHAASSVIDMEAKLMGSGDVDDHEDWDIERCARELAEANEAFERLEKKGKLKVIAGGKGGG